MKTKVITTHQARKALTSETEPLRDGELDYIVVVAWGRPICELHPPRIADGKPPEVEA